MKVTKNNAIKAGFSLVEMLVVIAVIGIIAAIAVPNIGRINDAAKDARQRRNAQNLASIFASAQAAGYDFAYPGGDPTKVQLATEALVIQEIIKGGSITEVGPFQGTFFGVPGLNGTQAIKDKGGAAEFLTWDSATGTLQYTGGKTVGDAEKPK